MSNSMRSIWWLAAGFVLALASCRPETRTAPVVRGGVVDAVYATGEVFAVERAEVAAEVSGRVVEVLVEAGDTVAAGAVLARLETVPLDQSRVMAEQALAKARSVWEQAKKDRDRYERLLSGNHVSRSDCEARQRAEEQAAAEVRRLEAQLTAESDRLTKTEVVSPIAGLVVARRVEPGEYTTAGAPLFSVIAPGSLRVRVDVDETEVVDVADGQSAYLALDAYPGQRFTGRVERVVPRINLITRTGEVRIAWDEPPAGIREGMSATVNVIVRRVEGALLVPRDAVTMGEARAVAWVVEAGVVRRVEFEPGAADDRVVEVKSGGLAEGMTVVLDPDPDLEDGQKVRTARP